MWAFYLYMKKIDINEFCSHFPGTSVGEMIKYIYQEKKVPFNNAVALGRMVSLKNNSKYHKPSKFRRNIDFLIEIGFIKKIGDDLIFNNKFIPLSQTNGKPRLD